MNEVIIIRTEIDSYEKIARITLQLIWADEFEYLEYSDRPDLIDKNKNVGIEVTHPSLKNEMMLNSFYYNELYRKNIAEINSIKLERFRKNGRDILLDDKNGQVCAYKVFKDDCGFDINVIFDAIDKKLKKLNDGLYEFSDNISLYLVLAHYSVELSNIDIAKKVLAYSISKQKELVLYFKEIFLDCLAFVYRIDLINETIEKKDIDMDEVFSKLNQTS